MGLLMIMIKILRNIKNARKDEWAAILGGGDFSSS
jgi:hypothetical protein